MTRVGSTPDPLLWRRMFTDLHGRIRSGKLAPATRLPSENELCDIHGVSRITVRRALRELEVLGLIKRLRGSGTEVMPLRDDPQTRRIHLVMRAQGHVHTDVHAALLTRMGELGYSAQTWEPEVAQLPENIDIITSMRTPGVILFPWNFDPSRLIHSRAPQGRIVVINPLIGAPHDVAGVGVDFAPALRELIERAVAGGIRSIVHPTFLHQSVHRTAMEAELTRLCTAHGLPSTTIPRFDSGDDAELDVFRAGLAEAAKPTLVVAGSDFIAARMQKLILRMHGRIPDEYAVTGLYDTPWSQAGEFTTIGVRPRELAMHAIDLLLDPERPQVFTRVPGELIVRQSGPLAAR